MKRENGQGIEGALRWIGDLDHPFYNDERQRFVWYEASAIGFQLLLALQLMTGGLTLLIFGSPAWKYVMLAVLPTLVTTVVIIAYANRHGAPYFATSSDLKRSRGVFGAVLALLWAAGSMRAAVGSADDVTWDFSTISGFTVGLGVVCGVSAGVLAVASRMQKSSEQDVDDFDVELD